MANDERVQTDSLIDQLARLLTRCESISSDIDAILFELRARGLAWRLIAQRVSRARGQRRRTTGVGRLAAAFRKRLSRRGALPPRRLAAIKAVANR